MKRRRGGLIVGYMYVVGIVTVGFSLCLFLSLLSDESCQRRMSRSLNANKMKGLRWDNSGTKELCFGVVLALVSVPVARCNTFDFFFFFF